jgi:hypothetical protein
MSDSPILADESRTSGKFVFLGSRDGGKKKQ